MARRPGETLCCPVHRKPPEGAVLIPITKGYYVLVDEADAEAVAERPWYALVTRAGKVYAARKDWRKPVVLLHQLLVGDGSPQVDHHNGDTLDNRRANLRPCAASQNLANRRVAKGVGGYKGVALHRPSGRYVARAGRGKEGYLGYHDTPEEAARAYDKGAIKRWGEFACTNESLGLLGITPGAPFIEQPRGKDAA